MHDHIKINPQVSLAGASLALQGVVVHHGRNGHGHYTTLVHLPNADQSRWSWWRCDGEHRQRVTEAAVLGSQAYLLLYRRT